eukprot:1767024-Pyramimonas_sp.AAC.1
MARSNLNLRMTPLRRDPQQPSNVVTVSQIEAPLGMARSNLNLRMAPLRWAPQQPSKVVTVSQIAAPPGMARSNTNQRMTPLRWATPAAVESGDGFADRSPPRMA